MPTNDNQQLNKEKNKVVHKYKEAEDAVNKLDIKSMLLNTGDNGQINKKDADKKWASKSVKDLEEMPEEGLQVEVPAQSVLNENHSGKFSNRLNSRKSLGEPSVNRKKIKEDLEKSKVLDHEDLDNAPNEIIIQNGPQQAEEPVNAEEIKDDQPIENEIQEIAHMERFKDISFDNEAINTLLTSDELVPLKGTRELADVRRSIEAIQAVYTNELPPIKLDKKGRLDAEYEKKAQEEMDGLCIMVTMLYKRLIDSTNNVLAKHGADYKDACNILKVLSGYTQKESESFREKLLEYRKLAISDKTLAGKKTTIRDIVSFNRGEFYDLDNDENITYSIKGAAASTVYMITKQVPKTKANPEGVEIVYFREKDFVPPKDNMKMLSGVLEKHDLTTQTRRKLKEILSEVLEEKNKRGVISKAISKYKNNGLKADKFVKAMEVELKNVTGKSITFDAGEYEAVMLALIDYSGAYAKRNMANKLNNSAKIGFERNLSDRNVATSRLATLLGIQSIICDSRTATIRLNGKVLQGNLMENAGGKCTLIDAPGYSMKAISQLFELQIFDYICGQTDRHFGNFNGIVKNGRIDQIRCFDNDMAFGNLRQKDIKGKLYNRMIPVTKEGILGLPTSFINRLMALDRPYFEQVLGDILNKEELDAMEERLNYVKHKVLQLAKKDKNVKWDDKKKQISFSNELANEELRQLYSIRYFADFAAKKDLGIEKVSKFASVAIFRSDIDQMIRDRKRRIQ